MSCFDNPENRFALIDFILILIIGVIHFVFFFYIKETDFGNIFDVFESSLFLILVLQIIVDKMITLFFMFGKEEK